MERERGVGGGRGGFFFFFFFFFFGGGGERLRERGEIARWSALNYFIFNTCIAIKKKLCSHGHGRALQN